MILPAIMIKLKRYKFLTIVNTDHLWQASGVFKLIKYPDYSQDR